MGRRKIEIVPITHERNRSVTLQKRCRGLMKKAYELGVLCSVEIAVIVFEQREGHKPKLYEYCSGDIRSVVQRHLRFDGERDAKGPIDFGGQKADDAGDDDDGDDDDGFSGSSSGMRRGPPGGMGMGSDYMGLTPTQLHHLQPSLGGLPSGFPSSGERSRSNTVPSYGLHKRQRLDAPVRTPYGFGLDMPASQAHHYPPPAPAYSPPAPPSSFALNAGGARGGGGGFATPRTGQLHAASFDIDGGGGGFDWPVHHSSSAAQTQASQGGQQQQQQQQQQHQSQRHHGPSAPSGPVGSETGASWLTDFFGSGGGGPGGGDAVTLPMPRRPSLGMGPSWDRAHDGAGTPRAAAKRERSGSGSGSGGSPRVKRENMDDPPVAVA